ncbi:MAG: CaiB/BaiF CoA transferase family protein [Actinomycetota bacterium]
MTASPDRPLDGVSVVDLTSNVAGPWASAVLADLGADVLHVESPEGDDARRMAPVTGSGSAYFHVANRNKRGERLDIRESAGRARLQGLIDQADVLVTNLRPATLARYGLDAATLRSTHPRLIHAALNAYGRVGHEADRAGYDGVVQARTGIASVTGIPDGPPVRAGVSVLDVGAGTWLALAVIAALYRRELTGEGSDVATSLLETGATWVGYHVVAQQVTGSASTRSGSGHPAFAPYGIYSTADGAICLGIGGDGVYARLCDALGAPHLASDARYITNADRVAHAAELRHDLEAVLGTFTARDALERLARNDVPADVVALPEDLLADEQAEALEVFTAVDIDGQSVRMPGLPITFDGERPRIGYGGPT